MFIAAFKHQPFPALCICYRHDVAQLISYIRSFEVNLDPCADVCSSRDLAEALAFQRAIVCRGTSCFRAKRIRSTNSQYVVKFSWRSDKQAPEGKLLKFPQQRQVKRLLICLLIM